MNEKIKTFWLGLFVICAIAIMVWLILFLRPSTGDEKQVLKVRFSNIQNVIPGTRVSFAGKPVGEVYEVKEVMNARSLPTDSGGNPYFYELILHVDSKVKVFSSDEIVFTTNGLMGEKSIDIIPKPIVDGETTHQIKKDEVLYARSQDQTQEAIQNLANVAKTFIDFIDKNEAKLERAIDVLGCAGDEACKFFAKANETNFVDNVGKAFTNLGTTCSWISSPQGTLGRLVESDTLYLKLSATLSRFEMTLSDINRYGLLFQLNKNWQRERRIRECRLQELSCPNDCYQYFNAELSSISDSMYKISSVLDKMRRENVMVDGACYSPKFIQLLQQIEDLQRSLSTCNQIFIECCP